MTMLLSRLSAKSQAMARLTEAEKANQLLRNDIKNEMKVWREGRGGVGDGRETSGSIRPREIGSRGKQMRIVY